MPNDQLFSREQILDAERAALRPDENDETPLSALCISGGGIRSATFALGAVQGLAEHGLLHQFDYLSTVSGGGYIGSWLTAWINREGGIKWVIPYLLRCGPIPPPGDVDPLAHLREYNSYLSPRLGSFSFDTWTLAATVLRNILLNWMVLIPLIMFALMIPRLFLASLVFPEHLFGNKIFASGKPEYYVPELDRISGNPLVHFVLPALSAILFTMALFQTLRYLPGVGNREHSTSQYLKNIVAPLVGSVLTFLTFDSLFFLGSNNTDETHIVHVILWTLVPSTVAWILYLITSTGSWAGRLRLLFGPLSFAITLMAAGAGFAAWFFTNFLFEGTSWAGYVTIGPSLVIIGFGLSTILFVGLSSTFLKDEDREWMSRASAGFLMATVIWAAVCFAVLLLPTLLFQWNHWMHGAFAATGVVSAWAASLNLTSQPATRNSKVVLTELVARVAPAVFLLLLAAGLSVLTNFILSQIPGVSHVNGGQVQWWDHKGILERTTWPICFALTSGLFFIGWFMARYININTFSLHAMYRDRLVRAYLGASNSKRAASRFTGFAKGDDIPMHKLDARLKPFHVVNLTLNLVASKRLDWQQRMAQPFTVTPLHCGNFDLGYRDSKGYGGKGGISLGTAITISGAAASPSMGLHSSPITGFIMTLFNARLGSWLGNPGSAGHKTWRHAGPRTATGSLIREALGMTSNESAYVYLSDGGHFENLGIYEMVLRRCRHILVIDSGCDPDLTYEDLGNALRKIRIDLRIPIEFDEDLTQSMRDRKRRCAVASIRYSAVDGMCDDGFLIYIKAMLHGNEPPDVVSYANANPDFPHQSTSNQWFDESQTESYRRLGLHTIEEICRNWKGSSLVELREHVETVYLRASRGASAS